MRKSTATPCPVSTGTRESLGDTTYGDTTSKIDYTSAFQASFRNIKPKRSGLGGRRSTQFVIHEDDTAIHQSTQLIQEPRRRSISKLSQPAKRAPVWAGRLSDLRECTSPSNESPHSSSVRTLESKHVPTTARSRSLQATTAGPQDCAAQQQDHNGGTSRLTQRPARRKTLWVPSDDTTQPTMWMGIFSPIKDHVPAESANGEGDPQENLTGIAAHMAERRKRRTSTINTLPKRVPLRQTTALQEQAGAPPDQPGAPTGKENLPPSGSSVGGGKDRVLEKDRVSRRHETDLARRQFLSEARLQTLSKSTSTSSRRSSDVKTIYEVGTNIESRPNSQQKRLAWNAGPRVIHKPENNSRQTSSRQTPADIEPDLRLESISVSSRIVPPVLANGVKHVPFIPLLEHVEYPEMYENDWLGHQEAAVTQLINAALEHAQPSSLPSRDNLRASLLEKYTSPEVNHLYSKVYSAALYGSLSCSHESLMQLHGLVLDVARKQQFIRFWLDNYDNEILIAAAEVVAGRQLQASPSMKKHAHLGQRQALAEYLECFLLRHQDALFKPPGTGTSSNDLGSKTLVKSIMLIKALDMLKEQPDLQHGTCLFRRTSVVKSSAAAVQTLLSMLNPAVGDPLRALRQLGYVLSFEQHPWQEITYRVDNLAVDLRDGVFLVRLAEVLLYQNNLHSSGMSCRESEPRRISMPEGETIVVEPQDEWPLTRHLKLPCTSRVTKLWNVQIFMGALMNVRNGGLIIENVKAEDIVDGFREKTVKLLWELVARFGLGTLIDSADLESEIRRLDPANFRKENSTRDCPTLVTNSQPGCERLLRRWTKAVAASRGLEVRNFTTSFSDGKVFETILDEYEPYLLGVGSAQLSLRSRLLTLGCSQHFSELFSMRKENMHIFGKDFVVAALAFLCCRMLAPSKLCRKAILVQRAWRKHWKTVQMERRAVKRNMALACATVVHVKSTNNLHSTVSDTGDSKYGSRTDVRTEEVEDDIWLSL